jgi:hypothetical protein
MRRVLFLAGLAFWFYSCTNSSNEGAAGDSADHSAVATDTNNASKNTGVDMSGGVNSGALTPDSTDSGRKNSDTTRDVNRH